MLRGDGAVAIVESMGKPLIAGAMVAALMGSVVADPVTIVMAGGAGVVTEGAVVPWVTTDIDDVVEAATVTNEPNGDVTVDGTDPGVTVGATTECVKVVADVTDEDGSDNIIAEVNEGALVARVAFDVTDAVAPVTTVFVTAVEEVMEEAGADEAGEGATIA